LYNNKNFLILWITRQLYCLFK